MNWKYNSYKNKTGPGKICMVIFILLSSYVSGGCCETGACFSGCFFDEDGKDEWDVQDERGMLAASSSAKRIYIGSGGWKPAGIMPPPPTAPRSGAILVNDIFYNYIFYQQFKF
jgi:hypothetical protein